jgi:uncharacterized membrane protein YphA (DoxX/SURF4 family)
LNVPRLPSAWWPWIGLAVRLLAAGIWLAAGAAKVGELETFRTQVAAYKVLPHALVAPFAYALPFVELGVGAYLAVGLLVQQAAAVACVLMAIFLAAQMQAWARGLVLDCGCFGAIAKEQVGFWTVVRDALLGVPSLVMLLRPARKWSVDRAYLGRPDRFEAQQS